MAKLEGKVALITGGTSGIGLATAKLFGSEGARVIVTGRRKPELDAAVAAIPGAKGYQVDSSRIDQLDALFSAIGEDDGRIDVLFVNAGGGAVLPLAEMTEAHFDDTYARNVKGVVFTVGKALPLLANGASVILNGSTAAGKATPGFSIYASSKAAVHTLTRNWMVELKDRGIRINTLVPGPTGTPGLRGLAGSDVAQQQALLDQLALGVPLGRVGDPEEIAHAALFLASLDSSFITGSELFVDGGEGRG